ncbi:hypothetical protein B0H17DRAFT_933273, partial [Mycena rosella]
IEDTGLCVEWSKAWARTRRWTEEVRLLKEEMRRVPLTLRWKATWWLEKERLAPAGFDEERAEGAAAYATRQAELYTKLAARFELMWAGLQDLEAVPDEGEEEEQVELDEDEMDKDGDNGDDGEGGDENKNEVNKENEENEGSVGGGSDGEDE